MTIQKTKPRLDGLINDVVLNVLSVSVFISAAIFLQQCHFLRHAGHSEKAVRLFQCLLDLTFFKTLSRTYPPDNR